MNPTQKRIAWAALLGLWALGLFYSVALDEPMFFRHFREDADSAPVDTRTAAAAMDAADVAWRTAGNWARRTGNDAAAADARRTAARWWRLAVSTRGGRPATMAEFRDAARSAADGWFDVFLRAAEAGDSAAVESAGAEYDRWRAELERAGG